MAIKPRYFQDTKQSFFLFGPRGTGKTMWLKQNIAKAVFIDLLDPAVYRTYSARPERIREIAEAQKPGATVVIDEIQKVPQLLDAVHMLIEEYKDHRFVLTGSSARKLKRSGVDLLAGRAVVKTMHPFMAAEMGKGFSMERALAIGMVPLITESHNPEETLGAYGSIYLREEVQMESLVRSIGDFGRFIEAISFSQGSVLSISDVARECEVGRKTVEGYVSVLEDLLLGFRLPVFTKRAKRHLISHPKFYYFDCGVFRSIRPKGPLDAPGEIDGAALESLVIQHLRAWNAYRGGTASLYFWRTKSGNEVDFVVYGPDTFCAVEVKNTARVNRKMLKGLIAFKEDYPGAELYFLYRGRERLKLKGVLCLPVEEFLVGLTPAKSITGTF